MNNEVADNRSRQPSKVGKSVFDEKYADPVDLSELTEEDHRFNRLFTRLVSAMTDFDGIDVDLIENILIKFSLMFRLSKVETILYGSPQDEKEGKGDSLCCFDTQEEGEPIITLRVVTSVMTISVITAYMCPDKEPLNDKERQKAELILRTVVSFISRNRLKDIVYQLTYYDEAGYPNLRNWNEFIQKLDQEDGLAGKVAFRYNLKHFELVNQEFGRQIGDVIIKEHFTKLNKLIGDDGYLARLGGDNFVGFCLPDKVGTVVDYLTETEVRTPKGVGVHLATSAGFFRIPKDRKMHPGEIMGCIVNAFRVAQTGGMDSTIFYDESFLESRGKIMKVQQQFAEAIEKCEFRAFYQPKVNIETGKLVGAEALCRWFRGNSIVPPVEFIPILEKTSDICKLDFYMLECVCKDMRRRADEGKELIRISINFSRKHIINTYLPETIAEIVDRYAIPHELIDVEFTESTSEVEFGELKRMATRLRDMGFYLSIDDFGIGYSSLNLIKDIPWTTLKIDKSFLPDKPTEEDSENTIMFRHVVSMTGQLGLECIAEGVETIDHLELLKKNGCDIAQGYFFDKPLPVEEFEARIDKGSYEIPEL